MLNIAKGGRSARVLVAVAAALAWCPQGAMALPCQVCEHNGSFWSPWQPVGGGVWTHSHFQYVANCQAETYDHLVCSMNGGAYQAYQTEHRKNSTHNWIQYQGFVWLTPDCSTDDGTGCSSGNPES